MEMGVVSGCTACVWECREVDLVDGVDLVDSGKNFLRRGLNGRADWTDWKSGEASLHR